METGALALSAEREIDKRRKAEGRLRQADNQDAKIPSIPFIPVQITGFPAQSFHPVPLLSHPASKEDR
jgi:hypothetical protein